MNNMYEVACRFLEEFKRTSDFKKDSFCCVELNRLCSKHLIKHNYTPGLCRYVHLFEMVRIAVVQFTVEYFDSAGDWERAITENKDKRLAEFEKFIEENKPYLEGLRDEFPSL